MTKDREGPQRDAFEHAKARLFASFEPSRLRMVDAKGPDRWAFGNEQIDFEVDRLRLRLVRDRGITSLNISRGRSAGDADWYPVSSVLDFLNGEEWGPPRDVDAELDEALRHWRDLEDVFIDNSRAAALDRFLWERVERKFGPFVKPPSD